MKLILVDAFAEGPFRGNPAAVCFIDGLKSDAWMRAVAAEMNQAETAFLRAGDGAFSLRWFTPTTEVDLCGHATLASAHVLWEDGILNMSETALFDTNSGRLTATLKGDSIVLDFPAEPAKEAPIPAGLAEAVGAKPKWYGKNRFDHFVEIESEEAVRELRPNIQELECLGGRGVIVTAAGESGPDFVSRFFAPGAGVPEDSVTGSAHCCLAPYWSARFGRTKLLGYQASPRGGTVEVEVIGDRVMLGGKAVTTMRGVLTI